MRITGGDFRSMIFPTQYRVPTYNRWLLDEADLAPAYRWHRPLPPAPPVRAPGRQWLLKSPAHLWSLDALAGGVPGRGRRADAPRSAQGDRVGERAGRPPARAWRATSRRSRRPPPTTRTTSSSASTAAWTPATRNVLPPEQVVDVQFATFVADPLATIGELYDRLGRELTAETEARMRALPRRAPRRRRRRRHPLPLGRHRPGRRRAARARHAVPGALRRRRPNPCASAVAHGRRGGRAGG